MTTLFPTLILFWSIFGIARFNHDYKKPIVISRWLDLFFRYGPIMYFVCAVLYLTHNMIKWRSEDGSRKRAPLYAPQTTLSLTRSDGHG